MGKNETENIKRKGLNYEDKARNMHNDGLYISRIDRFSACDWVLECDWIMAERMEVLKGQMESYRMEIKNLLAKMPGGLNKRTREHLQVCPEMRAGNPPAWAGIRKESKGERPGKGSEQQSPATGWN